jgi:hypothetical protein
MLKYAEHPHVLRIILDNGSRRNTMEGFDNEIPHDSGSGPFSLSTASFANLSVRRKNRIYSVKSVMPKSIIISTVLKV